MDIYVDSVAVEACGNVENINIWNDDFESGDLDAWQLGLPALP